MNESGARLDETAEASEPADWETGAAVRIVVFFLAFFLLGWLAITLAPLLGEEGPVAEPAAGPTAGALWINFMVIYFFPVMIMIGACARAVPPGQRVAAWMFDGEVRALPGKAALTAVVMVLIVGTIQFGWGNLLERSLEYLPGAWRAFVEQSLGADPYLELLRSADRETLAVMIIGAVVLAPVAEEMFFRRVLHRALWRRIGEVPADVTTAVLFGFAHVHVSLLAVPGLAVFGYVMQRMLRRSGSLALPILTHAIYNALVAGRMLQELYGGPGS